MRRRGRKSIAPYATRASGGEFDNRENIAAILELRREKARLLGYANFADLVLEDRMAKNGGQAGAFVRNLAARTRQAFVRENKELRAFAGKELNPWDVGYYAEKMRQAQYAFRRRGIAPVFPYEGVLKGMFAIIGRLYGIRVESNPAFRSGTRASITTRFYDAGRFAAGFVLRRLLSAREQTRRRVDGRFLDRQADRRGLHSAFGIELRQPHSAGWAASRPC